MDFGTQLAEIITRFVTELTEAIFAFLEEFFAALAQSFHIN